MCKTKIKKGRWIILLITAVAVFAILAVALCNRSPQHSTNTNIYLTYQGRTYMYRGSYGSEKTGKAIE